MEGLPTTRRWSRSPVAIRVTRSSRSAVAISSQKTERVAAEHGFRSSIAYAALAPEAHLVRRSVLKARTAAAHLLSSSQRARTTCSRPRGFQSPASCPLHHLAARSAAHELLAHPRHSTAEISLLMSALTPSRLGGASRANPLRPPSTPPRFLREFRSDRWPRPRRARAESACHRLSSSFARAMLFLLT